MSETMQTVIDDLDRMLYTERPAVSRNPFTGRFMNPGDEIDVDWVEATLGGEFLSTDDDYDTNDRTDTHFGDPEVNVSLLEEDETEWLDSDEDEDRYATLKEMYGIEQSNEIGEDRYATMAREAEAEITQRAAKKPTDSDVNDVEVEVDCDWELTFDEDWESPNLVDYDIDESDFRDRPVYNNRRHGVSTHRDQAKRYFDDVWQSRRAKAEKKLGRKTDWLDNAGLWLREEDEETAEYERELMIEMGDEMEDERELDYQEYLLDFASSEEYDQTMLLWWYEAGDNRQHKSRENPVEGIMAVLLALFLAEMEPFEIETLVDLSTRLPNLFEQVVERLFKIWLDEFMAELRRKLVRRLLNRLLELLSEIESEEASHQDLDSHYMNEDFPEDDYGYDDGLDTGAEYDDGLEDDGYDDYDDDDLDDDYDYDAYYDFYSDYGDYYAEIDEVEEANFRDRPVIRKPNKSSVSRPDTKTRRHHKKLVSRMRRERRVSDPARAWLDMPEMPEEVIEAKELAELEAEMEDENERSYRDYIEDYDLDPGDNYDEYYGYDYDDGLDTGVEYDDDFEDDYDGDEAYYDFYGDYGDYYAEFAEEGEDDFCDRPVSIKKLKTSFSKPDTKARRHHKKLVSRMRRQRRESDPARVWLDQPDWSDEYVEAEDLAELEAEMADEREFDYREYVENYSYDWVIGNELDNLEYLYQVGSYEPLEDYDDLDPGDNYDERYGYEYDDDGPDWWDDSFENELEDPYTYNDDRYRYYSREEENRGYVESYRLWYLKSHSETEETTDDEIGKVVLIVLPEHPRRGLARRWSRRHSPEQRREQKVSDLMLQETRANHHRRFWIDNPEDDEMAA